MATRKKERPKKIVYLWGAGATHAEAQHLGATVNLLMGDTDFSEGIAARILKRTGRRPASAFGAAHSVDIEKLISLLAASGTDSHTKWAIKCARIIFLYCAKDFRPPRC